MAENSKAERLVDVDYLRGIAMLAMIALHTFVFFLGDSKIILYSWNYLQFAVPLFVFCSAYLFFNKNEFGLVEHNFFRYVKKRFIRLLQPYYIFMLFFFVAVWIRQPQVLTWQYVLRSITLTGGVDIDWLVLLFIYLVFLMPFITVTYYKKKILFWLFGLLSLISSVLFFFWHLPFDYRYSMWLPWSTVLFYTFFMVLKDKKKYFYPVSLLISGLFFILFYVLALALHHPVSLYDNKYPPNILFLSYGIFSIAFLYLVARRGVFGFSPLKQLLFFLSTYSYSIFFIHYLLLYLISGTFSWIHFTAITFFLVVLVSSLVIQQGWNFLSKQILRLRQV